jgi:hypothetical protein
MCRWAGLEEAARFATGPANDGCEFVVLTLKNDPASSGGERDRRHRCRVVTE